MHESFCLSLCSPAKEPSDDEDDEVMVAKRKRELTDQYLAGERRFLS